MSVTVSVDPLDMQTLFSCVSSKVSICNDVLVMEKTFSQKLTQPKLSFQAWLVVYIFIPNSEN